MEQENFSETLDFKRHLSYLLCATQNLIDGA